MALTTIAEYRTLKTLPTAALIATLLLPAGALAQEPPTATAFPIAEAPVIDGRLDEAVWATGAAITDLVQREPAEG
ncbi:MAG: hypothetical protein ACR2QM_13225 [Longimicrobiales bacterium]